MQEEGGERMEGDAWKAMVGVEEGRCSHGGGKRGKRRKVTVDIYGLLTPSRFYKDIS